MLDPSSSAFVPLVVAVIALSFVVPAMLVWAAPRVRLRRVERRAAAGDPDAQRSMQYLEDLGAAINAGAPDHVRRREELIASGRAERAVIRAVDVSSTRVERGGRIRRPVELTLQLGENRRSVTVVEYVDELYVARLLVGADVPVFVDPSDPEHLTVGWDRA
jgi:hypothetical protein